MVEVEIVSVPKEIRDVPSLFDLFNEIKDYFVDKVKDVFLTIYREYIKPLFSSIVSALKSAFDPILDTIYLKFKEFVDWIKSALYSLVNIIRAPLDRIYSTIITLKDVIYSKLSEFVAVIRSALYSALSSLADKIRVGLSSIVSSIRSMITGLISRLSDLANTLRNLLSIAWQNLYSGLVKVGETIKNAITPLWDTLKTFFTNIYKLIITLPERISNYINNIVSVISGIGERIHSMLSGAWERIKNFVVMIVNTIRNLPAMIFDFLKERVWPFIVFVGGMLIKGVKFIATIIYSAVVTIAKFLYGAFAKIASFIYNEILRPVVERIRSSVERLEATAEEDRAALGLSDLILETFRKCVEYEGPWTFEKAWTAGRKYLFFCTSLSLISSFGGLIDDFINRILGLKVAGTGLGGGAGGRFGFFGRLAQAIYWGVGVGWLTWAFFSPIIRAAVSDPIQMYYRYKYRTNWLSREKIEELVKRGFIEEDEGKELLKWLGYRDEHIKLILKSAYTYPAFSYIQDMYDYGLIHEDKLVIYIRQLGYSPSDAVLMAELLKRRLLDEYTRSYRSAVIRRFKQGRITYEEAFKQLIGTGMSPNRAAWALAAAMWELEDEITDYRIKSLIEAYEKWKIDENTLRDQLADYIVNPELIDAMVQYASIKRAPYVRPRPIERLESLLRRLRTRVKSLQAQIHRLEVLRDERRDVYLARINYYKARRQAIIDYYENLKKIIEEEMKREFEAYKEKTVKQIEARIEELRIKKEARLQGKKEALMAYETKTKEELEARIKREMVIADRIRKELEEELAKPIHKRDERRIKRLTYEAERVLARIETLKLMAEARIEERRARVESDMAEEAEIYDAKIELLERMKEVAIAYREERYKATLEARLKKIDEMVRLKTITYDNRIRIIEEEMDKTIKDYNERIAYLRIKLDEALSELRSVESELAKRTRA